VQKLTKGAAAAAIVAVAALPVVAGDDLGISDAGSILAEAGAALGIVMAILGVVIAGATMMTNWFLALTIGGPMIVGGTIMATSEDVGTALWDAGLGGGDLSGVEIVR
jgi:hypothetical protein